MQVDRLGVDEMGNTGDSYYCIVHGVSVKICSFVVRDGAGNRMVVDTGQDHGTDCMFEGSCSGYVGKVLKRHDQFRTHT